MRVTPMEHVIEAEALFAEGWNAYQIKRKFDDEGKKMGIMTLYGIQKGTFKPTEYGGNAKYFKGSGVKVIKLREKVAKELEGVRKDVISRTTLLEEKADMEILERISDEEAKLRISTGDLTRVCDSAAKRRALAQGQPTDIFRVFEDEFSNKEIIEITDDNSTTTKESEGEQRETGSSQETGIALPEDKSV